MLRRVAGHWILKALLAAGLMTWLVYSDRLKVADFSQIQDRWPLVALAAVCVLPSYLLTAVRYRLLLSALGMEFGFFQVLRWNMIGVFFDLVMPMSTGGDVVKSFYVMRAAGRGRRGLAVLSLVLDRSVGLTGLFVLALLVCLPHWNTLRENPELQYVPLIVAGVCGCLFVGFVVATSRTIAESSLRKAFVARLPFGVKIEQLYSGIAGLRGRPLTVVSILLLSVANHAIQCGAVLILSRAMGMDFGLWEGLSVIPLALFLNSFGFASGVGVGNAAFGWLFQNMLNEGRGAALALLYQFIAIFSRLLGLPFYLGAERVSYSEASAEVAAAETSPVPAAPPAAPAP